MASRGDVLASRRRLGLAAEGRRELFVVMQSDAFSALETTLVVPLDDDGPVYDGDPLVVRVPAKEGGAARAQVMLLTHLSRARLDRFEPAAVGRVRSVTLASATRLIDMLLEIGAV